MARLSTERYLRETQNGEHADLKTWIYERAHLCAFIPRLMDALVSHETFRCLSRSQILDLALLGNATKVDKTAISFSKGTRLWVARGRICLGFEDSEDAQAEIGEGAFIDKFPDKAKIRSIKNRPPDEPRAWVVHMDAQEVKSAVSAALNLVMDGEPQVGKVIVVCATGERERAGASDLARLLADTLREDLPGPKDAVRFRQPASLAEVQAEVNEPGIVVVDAHRLNKAALESADLAKITSKVVHLCPTSFEPMSGPLRERPIVRCVLLDEGGRDRPPNLRQSIPWAGPFLGRFFPKDRFDAQVTSDPPPAYYPGTVRLLLTKWKKLARQRLQDLPDEDRATMYRLGRAATDRRVGVALGGGGALGFAHIALLEELERYEVPIDMVSGVSFGSLVGGFYAADGLKGLERLKLQRRRLQAALLTSSMVPPAVEWYLLFALLGTRLEEVPVPFFPVALNLETAEEFTPTIGSMARGIRMSSALPGMLTPYVSPARRIGPDFTLEKDVPRRLVDGATVNNVPEGILIREGADFLVASDVIALPPPPESLFPQVLDLPKFVPPVVDVFEGSLLLGGAVLKAFAATVFPFVRMQDMMRSMSYLTRVADDRDADFANDRFRPPLGAFSMWDFGKAERIMDAARQSASAFASQVKAQWLERGKNVNGAGPRPPAA
jgi:predicted acylesterase/phospholipase RssA